MKKKLLIVLSIIFVLIICTAVGIVTMKNKDDKLKENENIVSSGVEWGDLYIKYLKDNRGKNLLNVAKNKNLDMLISFIQLNPDDKPIMICQFEYKDLLEDKTEITRVSKKKSAICRGAARKVTQRQCWSAIMRNTTIASRWTRFGLARGEKRHATSQQAL